MGQALAAEMPEGVSLTEPDGGMFRWVRLPKGINASTLLPQAVARKVAYVPGAAFFAVDPKFNYFRLCFSNSAPDGIQGGVHELAGVIKEEMAKLPLRADIYTS